MPSRLLKTGPLLILIAVAFRSLAPIFAKKAALAGTGDFSLSLYMSPWYVMGLMSLFLQALVWMLVLSRYALSFAYPFMSLYFLVNLAVAHVIFGEAINLNHMIGAAVIMAGIVLIGTDKDRERER